MRGQTIAQVDHTYVDLARLVDVRQIFGLDAVQLGRKARRNCYAGQEPPEGVGKTAQLIEQYPSVTKFASGFDDCRHHFNTSAAGPAWQQDLTDQGAFGGYSVLVACRIFLGRVG